MKLSKKDLELMEVATQVVRDNLDLYKELEKRVSSEMINKLKL